MFFSHWFYVVVSVPWSRLFLFLFSWRGCGASSTWKAGSSGHVILRRLSDVGGWVWVLLLCSDVLAIQVPPAGAFPLSACSGGGRALRGDFSSLENVQVGGEAFGFFGILAE